MLIDLGMQTEYIYEVYVLSVDLQILFFSSFYSNFFRSTLEFLSNEGHIYSTIDDDHYKSTDSY